MREKRWLIVTQDGRHSTIGRHIDPTPVEIQTAGKSLDNMGIPGWLVVSEGIYYSNEPVGLLLVRRITAANGTWEEAERLWHEKRANAVSPG